MIGNAAVELEEKIRGGAVRVAVMGLGYVGLPLALAYARRGYRVYGIDVSEEKVYALNSGRSYIRDVASREVQESLGSGRFVATTDSSVLAESDVIFICVPTPFTPQKEPDTSHIAEAARAIAENLRAGQLVILRSTSYPGTTEEVFLAFAPERIDPGNTRFTLEDVPVVVGGCDPLSTHLAAAVLRQVSRHVVPVSSPVVAEMTKLLENVFRNVNIALVNQMAQLCDRMGVDVWEVIEAAATKPYGFMSFKPGLVGGHCIPVDPYYLAWKAREYDFHMDFIELAARVNESMPFFVVNKLIKSLRENGSNGGRILVLGVAFKRDVDDVRYSPALKVIELLRRVKFDVVYHDPYIPEVRLNGEVLRSEPLTPELVQGADCVLILTDHSCFDYQMIVENAQMVFDTRNATRDVSGWREKVIRL